MHKKRIQTKFIYKVIPNGVPAVDIYTDGSCEPNPGFGGWAAILIFESGDKIRISGQCANTTNNRMEFMGIKEALLKLDTPHKINLYSDSLYCLNSIAGKFNGNKNKPLIMEIRELASKHFITFCHVKGHSGNKYNTIVDQRANLESKRCREESALYGTF